VRLGPPEPHSATIAPRRYPVKPPASQPASAGIPAGNPPHRHTTPPQRPRSRPLTTVTRADHAPSQLPPPSGGARATANSGASNGSPIARSTRRIESGSLIAASSRRAPPQFGHVKISRPNTHSTQVRPRVVPPNCATPLTGTMRHPCYRQRHRPLSSFIRGAAFAHQPQRVRGR